MGTDLHGRPTHTPTHIREIFTPYALASMTAFGQKRQFASLLTFRFRRAPLWARRF